MVRKPDKSGVVAAFEKLSARLPFTPLRAFVVGETTLWCKCESQQPMGAFKVRGAWHRLTALSAEEQARGVVAFSSGNHAQGVAWAARELGIAATIVMPSDAPEIKLNGTRDLGAEIILYDRMTESREEIARAIAEERGCVLIPSFDDPWIVEGQGSAGLEALAQMDGAPDLIPDLIIVPCGGGGLAAGLALAMPDVPLVVVEPDGWDDMGQSLRAGTIVPVGPHPPHTSCDALQTLKVASLTFDILRAHRATAVSVSESETAAAMAAIWAQLGLVTEPGGAVALAAVLAGKVKPGLRTLVILSGGNVDEAVFARAIAVDGGSVTECATE
jgi:threonine dehydratase